MRAPKPIGALLIAALASACGAAPAVQTPTGTVAPEAVSTTHPTPATRATAGPTSRETARAAEPTQAAPAEPFAPIKVSGKGAKVIKFTIPEDQAAIATITAKGSDNFAVWSLASDGSENDLLVNVIGSYSGTVLFDIGSGEHSVAFRMEASGMTWTVTIKPVDEARHWNGTSKTSGRGDDVLWVDPPISGFATATFTHTGSDNFAVWAYSSDNSDLLINGIGHYNGQVELLDGMVLLAMTADGTWTITPD